MIIADWVALGLLALFALIGLIVGFGKGLDFFTSGVFGFIIGVIVCYCLGGAIYKLGFVQELLTKLTDAMTDKNGFCDFLLKIHIEVIVYYVALFVIVQLIRIIIVKIIRSIAESENKVLSFFNRLFGLLLFVAVFVMLGLLVFHIIELIGGSTAQSFNEKIAGSFFRLDKIFADNPLMSIIKKIRIEKVAAI